MIVIYYYTFIQHFIVRVLKDSEAMFLSIFFNLIPLVAVIVAIWRHFQWCCSPPYLVYSSPIHTYCTKRVALFMISKATSVRGNPLDRCSLLISSRSFTIFPMSPSSSNRGQVAARHPLVPSALEAAELCNSLSGIWPKFSIIWNANALPWWIFRQILVLRAQSQRIPIPLPEKNPIERLFLYFIIIHREVVTDKHLIRRFPFSVTKSILALRYEIRPKNPR